MYMCICNVVFCPFDYKKPHTQPHTSAHYQLVSFNLPVGSFEKFPFLFYLRNVFFIFSLIYLAVSVEVFVAMMQATLVISLPSVKCMCLSQNHNNHALKIACFRKTCTGAVHDSPQERRVALWGVLGTLEVDNISFQQNS